uniref:Uncharacterized protein n=1 Tax=Boodleopsis sp. FL1161 TaxID=2364084 RepID=A0A386AZ76_9CHLO|nr:hypothetical protein [Boodleopsis sp. FL1161]
MINDVEILHLFLEVLHKWKNLFYFNTWTKQKHFYFLTSYLSDQLLIPCFLDMSLKGITISQEKISTGLNTTSKEIENILTSIDLTQNCLNSSVQFTEYIKTTKQEIHTLEKIWPQTNSGHFVQKNLIFKIKKSSNGFQNFLKLLKKTVFFNFLKQ